MERLNIDTLSWTDIQLDDLAENQTITIVFTAEVDNSELTDLGPSPFSFGDITRNEAEATGTRTVEGVIQTFTSSDFAFNSFGDLEITKTSSVDAATPLSPGDTYTYTVTVNNPGASDYSNLSIYDSSRRPQFRIAYSPGSAMRYTAGVPAQLTSNHYRKCPRSNSIPPPVIAGNKLGI